MPALLRKLPLLAKLFLVAVLFCAVVLAQTGYLQAAARACETAVPASAQTAMMPMAGCHQCCVSMKCCLLSKTASDDGPSYPEPLSHERTQHLGDAFAALILTSVPTLDFLAPPNPTTGPEKAGQTRVARNGITRAAVSCIWLI